VAFRQCQTYVAENGPTTTTLTLLREVKERAERGDVAWLTSKGKVYAAVDAA
jgi:hypothetical protein